MEPTTPAELKSFRTPTANRELLARRLFSCPACGVKWVLFTPGGVEVGGVRAARSGDPAGSALVCETCLKPVDENGLIVGGSPN